ncbi:MAG: hypothetical protein EVA58_02055 [Kiritimatiellaceae bacterium]|nr:MAG: hypothetical protein EVA58_02055 [Kiritimatiellaceae bacterium]
MKRRGWRKWQRLHVGVNVLLAYLLLLLVFMLSTRLILRSDWSEFSFYALSDRTVSLLDELDQVVEITVLFQEEHRLYEDIEQLLKEYQAASSLVRVTWLDPVLDRGQTEAIALQFSVREAQVLILDNGVEHRIIRATDMMDVEPVEGTERFRITGFRGEQMISQALLELKESIRPKVYFLEGHGELSLQVSPNGRSLSRLRSMTQQRAIDVETLLIRGNNPIPDDADAVVIAGPLMQLSGGVVGALDDYLANNGRVMVLQDSMRTSGLESLLRRWGVALPQGIVVDPEKTLRGRELNVENFGRHPIGRGLDATVQLLMPGAVLPARRANEAGSVDQLRIESLMNSSEKSWLETNVQRGRAVFNVASGDVGGPLPLGLAIERGVSQGLDVEIGSSRLVVLGDSDFIENQHLMGANGAFFLRCLEWLIGRDELIDVAPRLVQEIRLPLDAGQMRLLFWTLVMGLPFLMVLLGGFVAWRRRS